MIHTIYINDEAMVDFVRTTRRYDAFRDQTTEYFKHVSGRPRMNFTVDGDTRGFQLGDYTRLAPTLTEIAVSNCLEPMA